MRPEIVLVAARADNGVIGLDGKMPWHISADLKHFKLLTVGKPVVMGRKTFDSMGKPLAGRHSIVLTRRNDWCADGVTVVPNFAEAVAAAGLDPRTRASEIMIIGGAEIYALAIPSATRIELTEIHVAPAGDTYFPPIDSDGWHETRREPHPASEGHPAFDFVTLVRRQS